MLRQLKKSPVFGRSSISLCRKQYALEEHAQVAKWFEEGRKGDKKPVFDGGPRERVCYHLLECGGGLTEEEIIVDLNRTRNVKWKLSDSDGSSVNYDKVITLMSAPSWTLSKELRIVLPRDAAALLDKQTTIKSNDGKWFLWCQYGEIDWGQRLINARAVLADAKEKSGSIEQLEKEKRSFLAEKEELPVRFAA